MTSTVAQAPTVLRQLIDERGIRHVFLADRAGITRSHFTRLLNRERPPTQQFIELMSASLGVDAAAFFDGRELLIATEVAPVADGAESGNTL